MDLPLTLSDTSSLCDVADAGIADASPGKLEHVHTSRLFSARLSRWDAIRHCGTGLAHNDKPASIPTGAVALRPRPGTSLMRLYRLA